MIPARRDPRRDLSHIHEVDLHDPDEIEEFVAHSYYDYQQWQAAGLHPYVGETTLQLHRPEAAV